MVNEGFLSNLTAHIQKGLGENLAGAPTVMGGGVAMDHYKGIGSKLATEFLPFHKETYQATEFLCGWIPLKTAGMPLLFFQVPVLDVKGKNIPGVGHFATYVNAPLAETIVTPFVGFSNKYVAMNALTDDGLAPKDALKGKARWTPLLEALNNEKAALRANSPKSSEATMGGFKVQVDVTSPMGQTQLAPYKGFTVITRQGAPALWAGVNKPVYNWEETVEHFQLLGSFVARYPQVGEEEGQQIVLQSNATMMDMLFAKLDAEAGARAVPEVPAAVSPAAPEAQPAVPPAAAEKVPCPTCGKPVGVGFRFCPFCRQELVWG